MTDSREKDTHYKIWAGEVAGHRIWDEADYGVGYHHYTHTARLLERVRNRLQIHEGSWGDGYNAALQDVERILEGGE